MEITGEFAIPAPRERVWEALNDPEVLRQCIPGCESIEREADNVFNAAMRAKIGPVKARFTSVVTLTNLDPPNGYTIVGEGKGGPAGFGKGSADVTLEPQGDETTLRYRAELQVGGKLAQIGSRLVAGAARKIADDFFGKFQEVVGGETPPSA
ncbi:MAG: carbon monoxide dehydrogenase subunit G [Ectothiorhodospiraceae bacterium]|nr:carbon monoxide dehydrogenase subunit G [Chromatiales bacterium]MCP5157006.1 carbon monoxide dehydrogenase subunit G [Ectothiorhodospiraceae bacterium]